MSDTELPTPSPKELKTPLGLVPETEGSKKRKVLTGLGALLFLGLVIGLSIGLTRNIGNEEEEVKDSKLSPSNGDGENATVIDTPPEEEPDWCGDSHVGNGLCKYGQCCSPWGNCGFTDDYCSNGQTVAPDFLSTDRFCGDGFPGNGTCANSTLCCSIKGTCEYT